MAIDWKKTVKPVGEFSDFKKAGNRVTKTAVDVVAAAIDKQIELFKAPRTEGRRWFEIKGENVAFSIRYANSPLKLVGEEKTVVVPKAQFVDVLQAIKADIIKGEFKAQLDAGEASVRKRSASMAETRKKK